MIEAHVQWRGGTIALIYIGESFPSCTNSENMRPHIVHISDISAAKPSTEFFFFNKVGEEINEKTLIGALEAFVTEAILPRLTIEEIMAEFEYQACSAARSARNGGIFTARSLRKIGIKNDDLDDLLAGIQSSDDREVGV